MKMETNNKQWMNYDVRTEIRRLKEDFQENCYLFELRRKLGRNGL